MGVSMMKKIIVLLIGIVLITFAFLSIQQKKTMQLKVLTCM